MARSTEGTTATRAPGRPRDPAIDEAVLAATRELLVEVGYNALAIDRVAARAGVSRAALYRRWASKGELVWEAVLGATPSLPMPDTGDIEQDLRTIVGWAVAEFAAPAARVALPGMMAELGANPELRATLASSLIQPEFGRVRAVIERGVERKQLRDDVDVQILLDCLVGSMMARATFVDGPLDDAFVQKLVDMILRGAWRPGARPRKR